MTARYKAAFALLALLNVVWGILWATESRRSPADMGVCVSYSTSNSNGTSVTWVSQIGSPIRTAGTQSCVEGSFVPVVAQ